MALPNTAFEPRSLRHGLDQTSAPIFKQRTDREDTRYPRIRVAISGGGVSGASLMHALLPYPHIDAHIFESAPQFREAGVAFGIARNALKALDLIGPSATACLERAGGVPMQGAKVTMAHGRDGGQIVFEVDTKAQGQQTTTIVQRANFLRELLSDIPGEQMHASKKLDRWERVEDGSLVLYFADGTTHACDILIGADGIRSMVRRGILGADDPAASPRNTGWWALMTLQPYEKARAALGAAVDVDDARECSWLGDGVFLLHNILSHGEVVQFSVCAKDAKAEGSDEWQRIVTAQEIEKIFTSDEQAPHLNKGVLDLLCDQPQQQGMYLWEHRPARTYVDGPVAVTGDAAHSTTPWQGSGAGFSIEDSMIMSTLLGDAETPKEATIALKVFDQVRRERTQRLVQSSYDTGTILTGQHEAGLDAKELRKILAPRWDFILDFDNAKHREEALELLDAELKKL